MQQKIINIGNSAGILIPKYILNQNGLKAGDKIVLEPDLNGGAFVVSKIGKKTISSLTPKFLKTVEKVNKEYGKALAQLATR